MNTPTAFDGGKDTFGFEVSGSVAALTSLAPSPVRTNLKNGVAIKADASNTGTLFVGTRANITGTGGAVTDGMPLAAGESLSMSVRSLAEVYVRSDASAQKGYAYYE